MKLLSFSIATSGCGLCHSDLSVLNNDWGSSQYPAILGHEVTGRVTAVGPNAKGLKAGQRVGVGWNSGSCMSWHPYGLAPFGKLAPASFRFESTNGDAQMSANPPDSLSDELVEGADRSCGLKAPFQSWQHPGLESDVMKRTPLGSLATILMLLGCAHAPVRRRDQMCLCPSSSR